MKAGIVQWNENQKKLKDLLGKPTQFDEAIRLCLEQHARVHASSLSGSLESTYEDELWEGLDETSFRSIPKVGDDSIAWNMWHVTRIEDITMNILIAGGTQVLKEDDWFERLGIQFCDTGNAMNEIEIKELSDNLNMALLRTYRFAVGQRSRQILSNLKPEDLKRKMKPESLKRILEEGAVLDVEGANWLIDFWGRKNVAGLLLMPLTRHLVVHINESIRLKQKCKKKAK